MPSLSGSHMSRTMSIGHSSRSSSSISVSSGRRFLANSFSDFKLSFSVLCASMGSTSLGGNAAQFAGFFGQHRDKFQNVVHNPDIGYLENRCLGILVDGDKERISFDASQVLECSTDAESQIHFGLHRFSRRAHLARLFHPLRIYDRSRATHRRTQDLSEAL